LKNQFRSLDEDEVDFLDSVLESTRAHEAAVKRETTEQLELFRKQQEKVDAALVAADARKEALVATKSTDDAESELWTVGGRKRKKRRHDVQQGLKLRKTSSGEGSKDGIEETTRPDTMTSESQSSQAPKQNSKDTTTLPSIEEAASKAPSKSSDLLASPQSAPSSSMPANILGLSGYSSDEDD
jgi:thioredoxin-like negative regulator of GroEL